MEEDSRDGTARASAGWEPAGDTFYAWRYRPIADSRRRAPRDIRLPARRRCDGLSQGGRATRQSRRPHRRQCLVAAMPAARARRRRRRWRRRERRMAVATTLRDRSGRPAASAGRARPCPPAMCTADGGGPCRRERWRRRGGAYRGGRGLAPTVGWVPLGHGTPCGRGLGLQGLAWAA